tara:strand:+ start:1317 stop:1505 length:189 start_codon:yes stop_codon:yes gene_type:complete
MKKITCIDCEEQFAGETPEEVMQKMMPHYMKVHKDVMEHGTEEGKKKWFAEFQKRWDEATDK